MFKDDVLVCIGDLETSKQFFEKCLQIKQKYQLGKMYLVHIADEEKYLQLEGFKNNFMEEVVDEDQHVMHEYLSLAKKFQMDRDVSLHVSTGEPKVELLKFAQSLSPHLIICGNRKLNRLGYTMNYGSVSNYLVHHVDCDVLIINDYCK